MIVDYQYLIDQAMLGIVKKVLLDVQNHGLLNDYSLYISFHTNHPNVILSKRVKQNYPKEITIVLQHQFKGLQVKDDKFSVNLAFHGAPETIEVPFAALTDFADPIANFSIQFKNSDIEDRQRESSKDTIIADPRFDNKNQKDKEGIKPNSKQEDSTSAEIISIDKFRKEK